MNGERENPVSPGRLEREILYAYSQQKGIPFEDLDDSLKFDPFRIFHDDIFKVRRDQLYFALATGMYSRMPTGKLEDQAAYFSAGLVSRRIQFLGSADLVADSEGREILGGLTLKRMSTFNAWVHGRILSDASAEFASGDLSDATVVKLVFWSKLDRITRRTVRYINEESDPNFDPEMDLDFDTA